MGRADFVQQYFGKGLGGDWGEGVEILPGRGWPKMIERHGAEAAKLRSNIARVAAEVKLPIGEFRRIVQTVQRGEREAGRAKKEIGEANLPLVDSTPKKYTKHRPQVLELVQERDMRL